MWWGCHSGLSLRSPRNDSGRSKRPSQPLQESRKPHQPFGPGTVAAFRIAMAGIARIDDGRAPGIGDVIGLGVVAMRGGSAGDGKGGEGEGVARDRREGTVDGGNEVRSLHI